MREQIGRGGLRAARERHTVCVYPMGAEKTRAGRTRSRRDAASRPVAIPPQEVALVGSGEARRAAARAPLTVCAREDLEDCYSQAILELVAAPCEAGAVRRAASTSPVRLSSGSSRRIHDRRRALSGRSPMQAALEGAMSLDGVGEEHFDVADAQAELERLVILRHELRRIQTVAQKLSYEQRLVIASQVALQMSCGEFCDRHKWTPEKYRKVAQRARARLRHPDGDRGRRGCPVCAPRVGAEDRDQPMNSLPPLIGMSPGTPAVGSSDDHTARPIRAQATGVRRSPPFGSRSPACRACEQSR
jgi:DNA-directed RNA polymerase specialized sigma24 family protein